MRGLSHGLARLLAAKHPDALMLNASDESVGRRLQQLDLSVT